MISSITTPGRYSFAYGNVVYQVTSTEMSQYKFRFVFDIFMNSERIARLKVTPQNSDWGQIDISKVLQSYMESEPINMGDYPNPISQCEWGWLDKDILLYNVLIGEEFSTTPQGDPILYNGEGSVGDPIYDPTGERFVINGVKDWFDKDSLFSPFYLGSNPPVIDNPDTHRFLTNSSRIRYVRESDWGTLSALNFHTYPEWFASDPVFGSLYEFFDTNGSFIASGISYNVIYNGGWRYDCSGNTEDQIVYPDYYKKMISYVAAFPKNVEQHIGIPPGTKWYRVSLVKSLDDATPPTPTPTNTPQPTPTPTSTPAPSGAPSPSPRPTSTPTGTPTPTPTPTDVSCSPCNRYTITNTSRTLNLNVTYTKCSDSTSVGIVVNPGQVVSICSCTTPVRSSGSNSYSIINEGTCR